MLVRDERRAEQWWNRGIVATERIRRELGFRPRYPTLYAADADAAL
ncbi:MAG TPA: hypothetical protein VHI50_01205 [Micromonosporaceae bacterium]|nr:hypothetical protein [Micromonosporaceae bacterium]